MSKIRRADLLSRVAALDQQITAQIARVRHVQAMGWNFTRSQQRLDILIESRDLYQSVLTHLLGTDGSSDGSKPVAEPPRP